MARTREPLETLSTPRAVSSAQRVLSVVDGIPRGKVMAYGDIAKLLGLGHREVARVLAHEGSEVSWWRVLRSNGTCAPHLEQTQLKLLRSEGVPMRGPDRVDMAAARLTEFGE